MSKTKPMADEKNIHASLPSSNPSRVIVERVSPEIDAGQFPIKRVVGEKVVVRAHIFTDGHEAVRGVLLYKAVDEKKWQTVNMTFLGNDEWQGSFTIDKQVDYCYTVHGFKNDYGKWAEDVQKKAEAGQDISVELKIGAEHVIQAASRANKKHSARLHEVAQGMVTPKKTADALVVAVDSETIDLVWQNRDPDKALPYGRELRVLVERKKALFSAWYEFFPRSWGKKPGAHGTFKDAVHLLPEIARMGFDVIYLPPIHPIGEKNRKGKNNNPQSQPDEPGCPWAIGNKQGGHKAIHPDLGTLDDFRAFVKKANELGIEVAMDFAIQCAPDHPYVKEHPEWFQWRPDGTVQFAENPPKKYEDVLPVNFETEDWQNLWVELKSIVEHWIEQGVTLFRVDNPHTKPFVFWDWLIAEIKKEHPDILFLSEAFTRPKVMYRLGKGGFSQSYTYFTWRNTKHEFMDYLTELTKTEVADIYRPNFWPNTPDILPLQLQFSGRPAYMMRLVLASTLSSNYGIYGPAFELIDNQGLPNKEEYANSEKYEIKQWDWNQPGHLKDFIALMNEIRYQHPALQQTRQIEFCHVPNDQILAYYKYTDDLKNIVLVVANMDMQYTQSGMVHLPLDQLGIPTDHSFMAHDLLTGDRYFWKGHENYVELNPHVTPVHVFHLKRYLQREQDFDYFS